MRGMFWTRRHGFRPNSCQDIWFAKETVAAELRTRKLTHPFFGEALTAFNCRTSDLAGTAMAFELMRAPDGKPQVRRNKMLGAGGNQSS